MSAGAKPLSGRAVDGNEDVGAIVRGSRAELLIVADGHFGHEASELAVHHVLEALGDDLPPADLVDEELVALFFDAGVAVQHETGRFGCPHPESRTTLALALVTDEVVQWAALGDSCVMIAAGDSGVRLDAPRSAYLGSRFHVADVAAAMTRGRVARTASDALVLATDGLVDALGVADMDLATAVLRELGGLVDAERLADSLVQLALEYEAEDAVTVAVAHNSA
jgi:serine/threonine protein phosphatase PrpC